jgi:hypothetical protein
MIPFRRTSFPHHGKRGVFEPVTEVRYASDLLLIGGALPEGGELA